MTSSLQGACSSALLAFESIRLFLSVDWYLMPAFAGDYTADIFNASKRYRLHNQKGVPLSDSELREIVQASDSLGSVVILKTKSHPSEFILLM